MPLAWSAASRRVRAALVLSGVVAALFAAAAGRTPPACATPSQDAPPAPSDAERRDVIRRALAFLEERVPGLTDASGSPRKQFTQATTGLALLLDDATAARTAKSLLPQIRGDLARWLERVAEESRDPERLPPGPGVADSRCLVQYVWPTAWAALLLAEMDARGVDRDEARKALRTAVRILAEARAANGGWGHGRFRAERRTTDGIPAALVGGYPDTLLASTNCAALGLGAAKAALGKEFTLDLEPTRAHYREAQLRNGSFPYDISQRSADLSETNAGRTAGAIAAMRALSMPRDSAWKRAASYLTGARGNVAEGHGSPCLNVVLGAIAAPCVGEDEARQYRDVYRARLLATRRPDGSLGCPCERRAFGVTCDDAAAGLPAVFADDLRVYTTALDALALLLMEGRPLRSVERIEAQPEVTPAPRPPSRR